MNATCSSCNCNPCACPGPTSLANARLINPTITGGTWIGGILNGMTLNGGTSSGQQITGATIDCTTLVCTQPPGTCDATVASTGFVCQAIGNAINPLNPNFCNAVSTCLAGSPSLCTEILLCINTTPGAINNVLAFDPLVFATSVQVGVARFATIGEVQGSSCLVAIDPCTLDTFFSAGGPNPLWNSFAAAVDSLITVSATLCAAVAACGFAPLASPVFTGDPQAPTPPLIDSDTSLATTAFVQGVVAATIVGLAPINNPVFTGDPQGPTPAPGDSDASLATTAFVSAAITAATLSFAPLASPLFTGDPRGPTAAVGDNDTSLATTAFVQAAIAASADSLFFSSVTVSNLAATETDVYVHNLAAGALAVNGAAIEFEASGTFAATGSVDKRIRVYFGATIVFDSGLLAITTAEDWHLRGSIVRTAAAAEKIAATLTTSDGTIQAIAGYSTAAENLVLVQPMKLTLNGTLANDVVGEFYRDRFISA